MTCHWVYYLFDSLGRLLYIGRSVDPKSRRKHFEKRTGVAVAYAITKRFATFEEASAAELDSIRKHSTVFNVKAISSLGALGTPRRSRPPLTEEHKAKIKAGNLGKPKVRRFPSTVLGWPKGKQHSAESKAKMRAAARARCHV